METKALRRRQLIVSGVMVFVLLALSGCAAGAAGPESESSAEERIHVVTTIAQIAEPLSVIGGDRVRVQSLMGPGVDPHLYNATQGDIRKLERADAIFYSGLHLEANMLDVFAEIGKTRPVLAIGEAIPEDLLLKDEGGAADPHVWFDIELWKQALDAATEQLKTLSPEVAGEFEANKRQYFAKLDELGQESKARLSQIPEEKRVLVTAHDAFGYFGRMLDIRVVGLQGLSTEDEIGLSDIEHTIGILTEYEVPAVFIESSINPASINAVIEGAKERGLNVQLGGELFSDAMGAAGTEEGTYLGMFRHNVDTIYKALSGEGKANE